MKKYIVTAVVSDMRYKSKVREIKSEEIVARCEADARDFFARKIGRPCCTTKVEEIAQN